MIHMHAAYCICICNMYGIYKNVLCCCISIVYVIFAFMCVYLYVSNKIRWLHVNSSFCVLFRIGMDKNRFSSSKFS